MNFQIFRLSILILNLFVFSCSQKKPAEGYYKEGMSFYKAYKFEKALDSFKQAVEINPMLEDAYEKIVECSKIENRLDEAIEFFDELQNANPDNSYPSFAIGLTLLEKKDFEKAIAALTHSIKFDPPFPEKYKALVRAYQRAQKLDEAIQLLREWLASNSDNAYTHYALGQTYIFQTKWDEALKSLDKAIHLNPDLLGAYYLKFTILRDQGKTDEALALCDSALAKADQQNNLEFKAGMLVSISPIYHLKGEAKKALELLAQALKISQKIGELFQQSSILNNMGVIYREKSENEKAQYLLKESLEISQKLRDREGEGMTVSNLGDLYAVMAKYDSALIYYEQSLQIAEETFDKKGVAISLGSIANIYFFQSNYPKSAEYGEKALAMNREIKYPRGEAFELGNLGTVYYVWHKFQKALDYYNQALIIAKELDDPYLIESNLGNIGSALISLGNDEGALPYLEEAQKIAHDIAAAADEAAWNAAGGTVYLSLGDTLKALQKLQQALKIFQDTEDRRNEATTYSNLAVIATQQKEFQEAQLNFDRALKIQLEIGDRFGAGETYCNLGHLQLELREKEKAVASYSQALAIGGELQTPHISWQAQFGLGKTHQQMGSTRKALSYYRQAIATIEATREQFLEEKNKLTFLAGKIEVYHKLIDLLFETEKNLPDIFSYSERAKTRVLLDLLAGAHLEINPEVSPEPLSLQKVQKNLLGKTAALLEYVLGEEHSYLLAVTSDASALYRLPAQKVIQEKVDAYFKIVGQAPTSLSPIPAGKQLFDMLLAPAGELLNSVKDLIIVPDGGLYVLAFETLAVEAHPNRTHYLVESYNVRYAPSASVLAMIKGRRLKAPLKHNMDLLAFADPIFNKDESDVLYRGSALERRLDLRRLPNTAMEVERIAGLFPQDSRKVYLREAAKEGIVKSEALTDYRYLHFATHGIFDETLPERSGIVLTLEDDPAEDGILQVQEIFNLKVDAEMVVLSACQTGRGKYMRGEGLLGLTGAFFSAGADALVVSLWRVSDASTADFMASFYDYIQQGKSKPQALRQAKLDFLKSTVAAKRHPFFWAPFVLVGMSESSNL